MGRGRRPPRPSPSGRIVSCTGTVGGDRGGARGLPLRAGIVGTALIAFLLVGCGGGSPPASVAHMGKSAPTTTLPPAAGSGGMPSLPQLYQDTIAYAGCMRSHGDPTFPTPTTVDNASEQLVGWAQPGDLKGPQDRSVLRAYDAANRTCEVLLPNSGAGPNQAQVQQQLAKDLKFSKCMRSHGLPNFPDPKESKQGISISSAQGLNPGSAQFQTAQKDCRSLVPLP
jgi:hypothetical protein